MHRRSRSNHVAHYSPTYNIDVCEDTTQKKCIINGQAASLLSYLLLFLLCFALTIFTTLRPSP